MQFGWKNLSFRQKRNFAGKKEKEKEKHTVAKFTKNCQRRKIKMWMLGPPFNLKKK